MELWVRDKSKTVLQKVERVEYNYRNGLHSVMVGLDSIGTYATQERCLEIIDEIQSLLVNNGTSIDKISALVSGIRNEFIVYEMPQE